MRRKKRASLSLSVNAIVVLVLGITMLGLGLAFTKGMFGKLGGKLEIPPPNIPATADEPIVLPADEVAVSRSKRTIIPINVYNDGAKAMIGIDFYAKSPKCTYTDIDNERPSFSTQGQIVPADQFRTFQVIVDQPQVGKIEGPCVVTIIAQEEDPQNPGTAIRKIATKQITVIPE